MNDIEHLKDNEYISPKQASHYLKVTPQTLTQWAEQGTVRCIKTNGGHRRYLIQDLKIANKYPGSDNQTNRRRICYCRVSTRSQLSDLQRQKEFFTIRYPSHEIVTDIGSGINFNRKSLNSILESAIKGDIEEIIVTHKDRLCRFAYPLIERIIQRSNGRIVVLNQEEFSPQAEIVNDLISIITCFSARVYGLRSHTIKKAIRESHSDQNSTLSSLSQKGGDGEVENIE